jgi:hypothetical protein
MQASASEQELNHHCHEDGQDSNDQPNPARTPPRRRRRGAEGWFLGHSLARLLLGRSAGLFLGRSVGLFLGRSVGLFLGRSLARLLLGLAWGPLLGHAWGPLLGPCLVAGLLLGRSAALLGLAAAGLMALSLLS